MIMQRRQLIIKGKKSKTNIKRIMTLMFSAATVASVIPGAPVYA